LEYDIIDINCAEFQEAGGAAEAYKWMSALGY
jgi:hypothetical protein